MTDKKFNWPRVRDLPPQEQQPFLDFLAHQTRPVLDDVPMDEQDGFYQVDYDRWKQRPATRYWD